MVIDSSAIIAILLQEAEAQSISKAIESYSSSERLISAPTLLEMRIVINSKCGEPGIKDLEQILYFSEMRIVPFTAQLTDLAFEAYKRYHASPARLNFGDCFAYALAKARNEPLLCKGNDFKHTDIQLVNY